MWRIGVRTGLPVAIPGTLARKSASGTLSGNLAKSMFLLAVRRAPVGPPVRLRSNDLRVVFVILEKCRLKLKQSG